MYIVKKRKRTNVLKQKLQKGIYVALMFIGFFSCLNWGIEYLRTVDWFVPKTIEILNREVTDSTSYDLDSLVPTGELPYVESGSGASGVKSKPPATSIIDKINEVFGEDADIAIAIAKAESHLNPNAVNINKNGSRDIGVFQINDCHNISAKDRLNAEQNIIHAHKIYLSGGWNQWSAFKNQSYLKYL
jgi:hypothetical protein